jgi:hypothetical protein
MHLVEGMQNYAKALQVPEMTNQKIMPDVTWAIDWVCRLVYIVHIKRYLYPAS